MRYKGENWIELTKDNEQWRALVSTYSNDSLVTEENGKYLERLCDYQLLSITVALYSWLFYAGARISTHRNTQNHFSCSCDTYMEQSVNSSRLDVVSHK
jgi:hypothetical protein